MCDPSSAAAGGVIFCCCCCILPMMVLATMAGPIMAILEAGASVLQCVNETVTPSIAAATLAEDGSCQRFDELGCEEKLKEAQKEAQRTAHRNLVEADRSSGADCAVGFTEVAGDVPGWGRVNGLGGGYRLESCQECADVCNSEEACFSYECSSSTFRCNLNTHLNASGAPYKDFLTCQKATDQLPGSPSDDLKKCEMLASSCFCDVAAELVKIDPPMKSQLDQCCEPLEEFQENPVVADFAGGAVSMCEQLAVNVSKLIVEVHVKCRRGYPPPGQGFAQFEDVLQMNHPDDSGVAELEGINTVAADSTIRRFSLEDVSADRFSQPFSRINKVLRPGHEVVQPLVASGGVAVGLALAATVLRRRVRAPDRQIAGATLHSALDMEVE